MTEGMGADRLGEAGPSGGFADGLLQTALIQVVAAHDAAARVYGKPSCRKDVLPDPFTVGIGVFALQGVGQVDRAVPLFQVFFMQALDALEVLLKRGAEAIGQHGHAVLRPFAVANGDGAIVEIQILHP
ncbi:MAG: hypothetical protein A2Z14_00395 [Chloroflexi bacterium RBG_16_48_8]|nr:MAG: hypothetical protein A2Z14_00395 [Chloroflexi bacterium RBG_16_48_8]